MATKRKAKKKVIELYRNNKYNDAGIRYYGKEIITLDLVKIEGPIITLVNTTGAEYTMYWESLIKCEDYYYISADLVSNYRDITRSYTVHFRLLNHKIDQDGKISRRRVTEKYERDLRKWEYAKKYNIKSKMLGGGGTLLLVDDRLTFRADKNAETMIIPAKTEKLYYEDLSWINAPSLKELKYMCNIPMKKKLLSGSRLDKIEITGNVSSLETRCFHGCVNLTSINIPSSVKRIGPACFENCERLDERKFNGTMNYIGERAFSHCRCLKKLRIPDGVKELREQVFMYCDQLEELYIPRTVSKIDQLTFYGLNHSVTIEAPFHLKKYMGNTENTHRIKYYQ